MEHIRKIVKSFRKFGLLIKDVTERIENETKEKRSRILGMLISTLGGGLLRQMLVGKGTIVTRQEQSIFKTGDGIFQTGKVITAGQDFLFHFALLVILNCKNISWIYIILGVHSRNSLTEFVRNGTYRANFDEQQSI